MHGDGDKIVVHCERVERHGWEDPDSGPIFCSPAAKTKGCLFIQDIPADTKNRFKAKCSGKGRSMRDVIVELMGQYANAK